MEQDTWDRLAQALGEVSRPFADLVRAADDDAQSADAEAPEYVTSEVPAGDLIVSTVLALLAVGDALVDLRARVEALEERTP